MLLSKTSFSSSVGYKYCLKESINWGILLSTSFYRVLQNTKPSGSPEMLSNTRLTKAYGVVAWGSSAFLWEERPAKVWKYSCSASFLSFP
jgi:hypothetical protein